MILGLDISTSIVGVCVLGDNKIVHTEYIDLRKLGSFFEKAQKVEDSLKEIKKNHNIEYIFIEQTREVATIVMLVVLAILVGTTWLDKAIVFLWTFAFWDLFYYLSLYILIKWPPKLTTIDVLFLIPRPWIAPVWVPIGISSMTILVILILLLTSVL